MWSCWSHVSRSTRSSIPLLRQAAPGNRVCTGPAAGFLSGSCHQARTLLREFLVSARVSLRS